MRRKQRRSLSNLTVGLLVLVAILIGCFFGFTKYDPFQDHYEISAIFPTANNVKPNSPVRIAGVEVGKVTEVEPVGGGRSATKVTMDLRRKGLPIHKDAQFTVRPRIFLEGNFFVDVRPGSPSAPSLDQGDVVPINQTRSPVQIDQVLSTLQAPTRRSLQELLDELDQGFEGEGADGYNRSITFWKPAYRDGAIVAEAQLGTLEHDLSNYLKGAGRTAEALDRDENALKALITDLRVTAGAFAAKDERLSEAIAELPRTLDAAKPALAALNRSFPALRRLIVDARPATRSSLPALDASLPLVKQLRGLVQDSELRGLVRDLRPTVPALTQLSKRTVPLYKEVGLASSCQNEVILPWTKDQVVDPAFPTKLKVFEEATRPLPGLAGESRSGDSNGQWFRVLLSAGLYAYPGAGGAVTLTGQPLAGVNPPPPARGRSPLQTTVDCETQQAPDLRSNPAPPPPGFRVKAADADLAAALKARAQDAAVTWLRKQVKRTGLADQVKVSTEQATRATIEQVRKQVAKARAGR